MRPRRTALSIAVLASTALVLFGCGGSSASSKAGGASGKAASSAGDQLVVLTDDQHLQTVDNIVPVVSAKVDSPALERALNGVTKVLTTADLVGLNKQADIERKTPAAVAKDYVSSKSLTNGLSGGKGQLVVGAANFSENQILANVFVEVLKAAGFDASLKPVTSRDVYGPALEAGQLQVMPEYVGTLTEYFNKKANGADAAPVASSDLQATLTALRGFAVKKKLTVLEPAQAADQNAFAVTRTFADANKLHTLSDVKAYQGSLVLGGPPECPTRPFCQAGLEKTYGLHFTGFVSLDAGGPLTKAALKQGKVQLGLVFSSDGSLTPSS